MIASSRRKAARLGAQAHELMIATPQVVAHRVGRMAMAGPRPSLKDQREFERMSAEKLAAFGEAWQAMTLQMLKSNQQFALSMLRSSWPGSISQRGRSRTGLAQALSQWQGAALDVLAQGVGPVHRRAVANAKRLCRLKSR